MKIPVVLRVLSVFLLIFSFFLLIPILVALWYGEYHLIRVFAIPAGVNTVIALLLFLGLRSYGGLAISIRGGFLFVSLAWITAAASGAMPFYLSGEIASYTDAFFETMSGFTTTGASILTNIEGLSYSLLFWRSLTHWLGGMGIVVLTVALFPLLGIGGFQLLKAEAPGPSVDKITPRITETAKILWIIYLSLTVAETLLLLLGGMDLFDSLTHTFGTLATGGFSPKNSSVGFYSSGYIHVVITIFMYLAGVNFIMYFRLVRGDTRSIIKNTEFRVYTGIFIVASLLIALDLYGTVYNSFSESLRYAGFQAASILTTTGYATADFAAWPAMSRITLFILMFIGGSAGSTGGGMKVIRVVTIIKQGFNEMKYLIYPRGVFRIHLNGRVAKKDAVYVITGMVSLYFFLLLVVTFVVASAGNTILTSFSTALVTLGNIGPGFGMVGPTENYAFFPDYVKWFLSFVMMVGRLEIYTVLVLFTPIFWHD
ncbi:MAG TPA: potassium transporter TrkG [Clostridia bacterium]|nr:potassium transporter TrkG [Clostridia bacterium]